MKPLKIGLIADMHYAQRPNNSGRRYAETLQKAKQFYDVAMEEGADLIVQMGDLKDEAPGGNRTQTINHLDDAVQLFQSFSVPVFHLLGNHDLDCISREDYAAKVGGEPNDRFFSFDREGWRLVFLDTCYSPDGTPYSKGNFFWEEAIVPEHELEWLKNDLESAKGPVVVFLHHCLDYWARKNQRHFLLNAEEICQILEQSGKVKMVFQGHFHAGNFSSRNGVNYFTLKGTIEKSSGFGVLAELKEGQVTIKTIL